MSDLPTPLSVAKDVKDRRIFKAISDAVAMSAKPAAAAKPPPAKKASAAAKPPPAKKASAGAASAVIDPTTRGVARMTQAKYAGRPSPPFPAQECKE